MASRTQTLVQLTDELVGLLDRQAAALGISRSKLIRDLLERALIEEAEHEQVRRMVEGYEEQPQSEARDVWGDLDAWSETVRRRNLAAMSDEEPEPW